MPPDERPRSRELPARDRLAEVLRRQGLGLLLLAALLLLLVLLRAPAHLLFPPGWWRP